MGSLNHRSLTEAAWRFAGTLYLSTAALVVAWMAVRGDRPDPYGLIFIGGCGVGFLLPRVLSWEGRSRQMHWFNLFAASAVQAVFVPWWYEYPPLLLLPAFGAVFVAATARRRWLVIQMAPAIVVLGFVSSSEVGLRVGLADTALYGSLWVSIGLVSAWLRSRIDTVMSEIAATEQERLESQNEELQAIVNSLPLAISWKDTDGRFLGVNSLAADDLNRIGIDSYVGHHMRDVVPEQLLPLFEAFDVIEKKALTLSTALTEEVDVADGVDPANPSLSVVRFTAAPYTVGGRQLGVVTSGEDVTETRELQRALATQGRMESIGQLAAGVAHEINTPVQFVSDNTRFLSSSFEDLIHATNKLAELAAAHEGEAVQRVWDEVDVDFILAETPPAIDQCLEGLARVARIARALKEFSHPNDDVEDTDLNGVIRSTVDVSRNEWKYVAEVEFDLDGELPPVPCSQGRVKQVVLNLLVNASHAIGDRYRGDALGCITVATSSADGFAHIAITDDGIGMEPAVKERIFDQFFTTKEVGRGTGQGLSLAWDVVQTHGGSIAVDSVLGQGSTFTIRLPLDGPPPQAASPVAAGRTTG